MRHNYQAGTPLLIGVILETVPLHNPRSNETMTIRHRFPNFCQSAQKRNVSKTLCSSTHIFAFRQIRQHSCTRLVCAS